MYDGCFPLWDQTVSVGFRANAVCFFLAAPLCPLLLLWDITRAARRGRFIEEWWVKYSLTFANSVFKLEKGPGSKASLF